MKQKVFLISFFSLLFITVVVVLCLPSFFSTSFGREWLLKRINAHIPGHVHVAHCDLSWFGSQRIENFELLNERGDPLFHFDTFTCEGGIGHLLFRNYHLGEAHLHAPNLTLYSPNAQETTLPSSGSSSKKKLPSVTPSLFPLFGNFHLTHGTLTVSIPSKSPFVLENIEGHLTLPTSSQEPLFVQLSTSTHQEELLGMIDIEGTFPRFRETAWKKWLFGGDLGAYLHRLEEHEKVHFTAKATHLAVPGLDQLLFLARPELKGVLTAALGEKLELAAFKATLSHQSLTLETQLDSSNGKAHLHGETYDQIFHLDRASTLSWMLTPQLSSKLLPVALSQPTNLTVSFEELAIPLIPSWLEKLACTLHLELAKWDKAHLSLITSELGNHLIAFCSIDAKQEDAMPQVRFDLKTQEPLKAWEKGVLGKTTLNAQLNNIPTPLLESFLPPSYKIPLATLLGSSLHLSTNMDYRPGQAEAILSVDAPLLRCHRLPLLYAKKTLSLKEPTSLQYTLTMPALSFILGKEPSHPLLQPVSFAWKVSDFSYPLTSSFDAGHVVLNSELTTGSLTFKGFFDDQPLTFSPLSIQTYGSHLRSLGLLCHGKLKGGNPQSIFSDAVGEFLECKLTSHVNLKKNGHFSDATFQLLAHNPQMELLTEGKINAQGLLTLTSPTNLHTLITPKLFSRFFFDPYDLCLTEPAEATLLLSPTEVSLSSLALLDRDFSGTLSIPSLKLKNKEEATSLTQCLLPFKIQGKANKAQFHLTAEAQDNSRKKSPIDFSLNITDYHKGETLSLKDASFQAKGEIFTFPLPILEAACGQLGKWTPFLGPTLHYFKADVDVQQMNGPLSLDISATNSQLHLKAQVAEKKMTLTEPLVATLKVTPDLSTTLLKEINPLLITAISAKEPIKLTLFENTQIPLFPFSLEQLNLEKGLLELGKLQTTNGGILNALLGFLKKAEGNSREIWCTPIAFRIDKGKATLQRMDALIDGHVPIASWGTIDLSKDRVKMFLAIDRKNIEHAFSISELPEGYMLVLPMKGTPSKISIDWNKASAKIASLIAHSTEGSTSEFFGELFDVLGGGTDKEQEVPPPLFTPLPWNK